MRTARLGLLAAAILTFALGLAASPAAAGDHRVGFGFHYWKTLDQIEDDGVTEVGQIDDDGYSELLSYQYLPSAFLKLEVDLEYFNHGFGGAADSAYSPQFFLLVGHGIYGGLGVGVTHSSAFEDSWSDPYYAARAGFEWGLLPRLDLDLNANYRFNAWSELENVDTGTLTLGAVVRLTL